MPLNEATSQKRINKVDEVYEVGASVEVLVIDADTSRAKLVVSRKALEVAKERAEFEAYFSKQEAETPQSTLAEVFAGLNLFEEEEQPKTKKPRSKKAE